MKDKIHIFHNKMVARGVYSFAGRSMLRLLIVTAILGFLLYLAQTYINDFGEKLNHFLQLWDPPFILTLFFISETILGLIPPDFFIVWSTATPHPYLYLTVFAILSYTGGMLAYYLGYRVARFPKIHAYILSKFSSNLATLHRYGGFLIVFAALFPLPFSVATLVAGAIEYPFKRTALLGLTRLLRFFLYALVLFKVF